MEGMIGITCINIISVGIFYSDQEGVIRAIVKKIKKIWAIIMNKDFYYAEIIMSKRELETYKEWLNQF